MIKNLLKNFTTIYVKEFIVLLTIIFINSILRKSMKTKILLYSLSLMISSTLVYASETHKKWVVV